MAHLGRILIEKERLRGRVDELGAEIAAVGPADLVLVSRLTGGFVFLADLVRRLGTRVEVDFLGVARYSGDPPGTARVVKDLAQPIHGRHVLVVEDVVDTGLSMRFLLGHLEALRPASLRVCTLLDRVDKRLVDLPVAFRGFALGDEYLVGYGLDFLGLYRTVPCLVAVDDLAALHADPLALVETLREWRIWRA